jgi:biopolymer transport protein ExbD
VAGRIHGAGAPPADPNLTPLLDLVLQLIMFFMITVNFVQTDQINEEVVLPVAQAAVPMDQTAEDWVFLNMDKNGKLVGFQEEMKTQGQIKAYLQSRRQELEMAARERGQKRDINIVVVLRADREASYGDVWEVLQNCTKAGYRRWQLRVITQAGGPS